MSTFSADAVRAQAAVLTAAAIDARRAEQIAADIGRIIEALDAARGALDFNDEPARFAALLDAAAAPHPRGR